MILRCLACILLFVGSCAAVRYVHMCTPDLCNNSQIYCGGPILPAVGYWKQVDPATFGDDSKDFVDRPMFYDPDVVLATYYAEFNDTKPQDLDPVKFKSFLDANFDQPGQELEACVPTDWKNSPKKISTIVDKNCKNFAMNLNDIWKQLCRKPKDGVYNTPSRHSLLEIKHPFIAPGGRFREFYYWDTFWIIKGLLVSGMTTSAEQMIENLAYMVDRYGFVPNGGRVYYLRRSQPPFLTPMVYFLYSATGNRDFVKKMLPLLDKEFQYWQTNTKINITFDGVDHDIYQYVTPSNVPRPESYKEDVMTAVNMSESQQQYTWHNLASAAMSGIDFSTRWTTDDNDVLRHLHITEMAPVDLNALMHYNMRLLSFLHSIDGNTTAQDYYNDLVLKMLDTMEDVFFNKTENVFFDLDLKTMKHIPVYYPSQVYPLWTGSYRSIDLSKTNDTAAYFKSVGALDYPYGIPSSMITSGQQWDFPNAWPPHNWMIIDAFRKSEVPQIQELAFDLAQKFVQANYEAWKQSLTWTNPPEYGAMFEKLNVTSGIPGGGGEYDIQIGFGWTNGAVLDLMYTYSDRIECNDTQPASSAGMTGYSILFFLLSLYLAL